MKLWPCSLWVEIFVNLGIYFLVWPGLCQGNFGKFYLKPYLYYINFWSTKTLLCKLWGKWRGKMGIFSLVPRVIPPVTSHLSIAFLMHIMYCLTRKTLSCNSLILKICMFRQKETSHCNSSLALVSREPSTIFLATNLTRKMPESSDFMYSSFLMLENIWYHHFT